MTKPERILWRALRDTLPDHHWRKQVPLGSYYADFASHSAKLIIEVDGGQHATARHDAERTRFLGTQGFRVLRFWNNDVVSNVEGVLETIAAHLASPLVGEVGGGRPASAGQENLLFASSATAADAPPPNPPHKGEGFGLRKFAKGAGAVVLGLVALDLLATVATLALGWGLFKR